MRKFLVCLGVGLTPAMTAVFAGVVLFAATTHAAIVTIDFEGVSDTHYFLGGNQNLGTYYSALPGAPVFGVDATILDKVIYGYNDVNYPPKSGNAVLFSDTDPTIRVDFGSSVKSVELWYTSGSTLNLQAFDSTDTLIASSSGASNLQSNSLLSVSVGSYSIAYVKIFDRGNFYTIDDFSYDASTSAIPEPASSLIWGFLGIVALYCVRRRRKV